MPTSSEYIDRAKRKLGFKTDTALADYLGVRSPMIPYMRKNGLSDRLAVRIAEAAEVDAGEVLTVAHAEREKDEVVKVALMTFAKKSMRATLRVRRGRGANRVTTAKPE